jgi:hypothetical protein
MATDNLRNSLSNMGSAPRSSEGIYNRVSEKTGSLFSPNKASNSRLLSVPESLTDATEKTATPSVSEGSSAWRYLIIFLILIFLSVNLILFLIKPVDAPISQMYDPLLTFSNKYFSTNFKVGDTKKGPIVASVSKKNNKAALKKLEKAIDEKPLMNNIDKQNTNLQAPPLPEKRYKKLPVIPEADDSMSRMQMNPTSKTGFCYIGEDRGFRSCIEVGEGDVCMSGNIFPSEAICINPNLRE